MLTCDDGFTNWLHTKVYLIFLIINIKDYKLFVYASTWSSNDISIEQPMLLQSFDFRKLCKNYQNKNHGVKNMKGGHMNNAIITQPLDTKLLLATKLG